MADTKISDLTPVTSLDDIDEFVVARSGASNKIAGANIPGYEFAYVEFTSNVSITASAEASATQIVSAGSVTFDGSTRVKIEFFSPSVQTAAANQSVDVWLYDGTSIGKMAGLFSADALDAVVSCSRFLTPSAAAHTYTIRATRSTATNIDVRGGAGGSGNLVPGFVRITRA